RRTLKMALPDTDSGWMSLLVTVWPICRAIPSRARTATASTSFSILGGRLSSRVRAGIGVDQWTSRWGAGKQTWLTSYNLSVYYYPLAHRTLFLQAGAGGSDYSVVHVPWQFLGADRADTVYLSGSAWGATAAV